MDTRELDTPTRRERGEIIMARRMLKTFRNNQVWIGERKISWESGRLRMHVRMLFDTLDKFMINRFVLGSRYKDIYSRLIEYCDPRVRDDENNG